MADLSLCGRVRNANAWRCRKQCKTITFGATARTNAPKPEFLPNMKGAPSVHMNLNFAFRSKLCYEKTLMNED